MVSLRTFSLAAVALVFTNAVRADESLASKIEAVIKAPEYQSARWGILVVDAETNKVVYEQNADKLFSPASVTKLYSCGAALAALGKDYKFDTPVYRRGEFSGGVLKGDLILVASGDFALGGRTMADGRMAFKDHDHIYAGFLDTNTELTDTDPLAGIKALAHQVKEAGVKEIKGDVLIDDRLFEHARGSGSGPDIVTPIMVNDNIIDVTVKPGAEAGEPAQVEFRPKTDYIQIDAKVATVSSGKPRITTERVGPQRYVVRGTIAVASKPVVRICPVDEPNGFAQALFIEALRKEGITVDASILKPPTAELPEKESYAKLMRVALLTSPPLSEALKVTLKVSHNLYASCLPMLLAVKSGKRTLTDGLSLQGKALKDLGVDIKTVSFQSGAGGGNGDRATPRTTVQLLQKFAARADAAEFRAMLPILGDDGTLVDVVPKDSPARGKVVGKTGTYTDADLLNGRVLLRSKALAGYMTSASGRPLIYAMFVNDVLLAPGGDATREGKARREGV